MSRGRRYYKRKASLKATRLLMLIAGFLLIVVSFAHPLLYRVRAAAVEACLVPYTRLVLSLSRFNDSLGAKQIVVLYSPCNLTRCSTILRSVSIPISALENERLEKVNIGRGILVNILIGLAANETIPATVVSSLGSHGSSLVFAWNYPDLRAVLYVALLSRRAVLSVKETNLMEYNAPRGCKLLSINNGLMDNIYIIKCKYNIYTKQLRFSRSESLFEVKQVIINKYSCPGMGTKQEYINLSPILIIFGFLLEVLTLYALKTRH